MTENILVLFNLAVGGKRIITKCEPSQASHNALALELQHQHRIHVVYDLLPKLRADWTLERLHDLRERQEVLRVSAVSDARVQSCRERGLGDLGHVVEELLVVPVLQQLDVDGSECLNENLTRLRVVLLEHEVVVVQIPILYALE